MSRDAPPATPESGIDSQQASGERTPLRDADSDRRSPMLEAGAMLTATVLLALLGSAIFGIAAGAGFWVPVTPLLLAGLGWKVPLWALAVVAIALAARASTPRRRALLATAAAPAAACLAILLEYGPLLPQLGTGVIFWAFRWGIDILWFTICACLGSFTAVTLIGRVGRIPSRRRISILAVPVLQVAGGALTLALFVQWLGVYFTLWNTEPVVTAADGVRYLWTAGTAVALLGAAVVVSGVRSKRSSKVLSGVLLAVALLAALVFAVPSDRWFPPAPEPVPAHDDYVPCFGEGDPNCVGG